MMQTPEPTAREMVAELARALQSRRRRDAYRALMAERRRFPRRSAAAKAEARS